MRAKGGDINMNQIGDRLRKLLESTGLKQNQFAENINMKQTTYNG